MLSENKNLDIVLIGATGYTGSLCAEHIAKSFPTYLRWGIAGRSLQSLELLQAKLQKQNPDRLTPGSNMIIPSVKPNC